MVHHRLTCSRQSYDPVRGGSGTRPGRHPVHHNRWAAQAALSLGVVVAPLLSGCGGQDSASPDKAAGDGAATASTEALWAEMRQVVDRPAVPLRAPANLKPAAGFDQADVDALADRTIDILRRSTDPNLSRLNPSEAINRVHANQYAPTTFEFKQDAIDNTVGYDRQWLAPSRYPKTAGTPTAPKVLKVTGAVTTDTDEIDAGEQAPFLTFTVQAHIAQTVTSKEYGRVPIVVRRTVRASGFRPRGGPEWWPSVMARTAPFGNTACGLFEGAILDPLDNAGDLREDLANLNDSLDTRGVVPGAFDEVSDPDELRDYIETECAKP